jgi:hypothetical protein
MAWTLTAFFDILKPAASLTVAGARHPSGRGAGVLAAGFQPRLANYTTNTSGAVSCEPRPGESPALRSWVVLRRALCLNQPLFLSRLIRTPSSAKPFCTTLHYFALLCSDFASPDHGHRPFRNLNRPCSVPRLLSAEPRELSKIFKVIQRYSKIFKAKFL